MTRFSTLQMLNLPEEIICHILRNVKHCSLRLVCKTFTRLMQEVGFPVRRNYLLLPTHLQKATTHANIVLEKDQSLIKLDKKVTSVKVMGEDGSSPLRILASNLCFFSLLCQQDIILECAKVKHLRILRGYVSLSNCQVKELNFGERFSKNSLPLSRDSLRKLTIIYPFPLVNLPILSFKNLVFLQGFNLGRMERELLPKLQVLHKCRWNKKLDCAVLNFSLWHENVTYFSICCEPRYATYSLLLDTLEEENLPQWNCKRGEVSIYINLEKEEKDKVFSIIHRLVENI